MKKDKIIYWISTGLLSLMMILAARTYIFNHEAIDTILFTKLGYPAYLIYPLAIAKLLGITAILSKKSEFLKSLAYAGFFFDFILAASAHIHVGDGFGGAALALILLIVSFQYDKKLYNVGSPMILPGTPLIVIFCVTIRPNRGGLV